MREQSLASPAIDDLVEVLSRHLCPLREFTLRQIEGQLDALVTRDAMIVAKMNEQSRKAFGCIAQRRVFHSRADPAKPFAQYCDGVLGQCRITVERLVERARADRQQFGLVAGGSAGRSRASIEQRDLAENRTFAEHVERDFDAARRHRPDADATRFDDVHAVGFVTGTEQELSLGEFPRPRPGVQEVDRVLRDICEKSRAIEHDRAGRRRN